MPQPKNDNLSAPPSELSFVDIQKLLGKAAEESKENMKPKYKQKDLDS
ncbi:MAG: hypothetical protein HC881_04120 [Leptolyngbyaceae cyanobacterium SL_7_1]|nr:hypothetical protein [Leptolyngbyaceae cyanobacterium SL_7_1]